jgi:hypothetical protein
MSTRLVIAAALTTGMTALALAGSATSRNTTFPGMSGRVVVQVSPRRGDSPAYLAIFSPKAHGAPSS